MLLFLNVLTPAVILFVFARRPLPHLDDRIDNAQHDDTGSLVETIDNRVGDYALRRRIGDTQKSENVRENKPYERACITQKALDRISTGLLFLVNHVADKHFKRLHGHVDGGVEKHKGN